MAGVRRVLAVVAMCALILAACGDGERRTSTYADGGRLDARVSCEQGTEIPVEVLDAPELPVDDELVIAASREGTKITTVDYGDPFPKEGWRLVQREGDRVTMLNERGLVVLVMERVGGSWRYESADGCRAGPDLGGRGEAEWYPATDVAGNATQFTAHVTALACSSGRSAQGRIDEPLVEYRDDAILILFTVEPLPAGAYMCPGSPPAPFTVKLREPRGNRRLLDARRYPPEDVTDVRPRPGGR